MDIVIDKTISSTNGVEAPCSKRVLTSHSFLGGSKLYSLCEGLDRMELKSLSHKNSRRLCKGTRPVKRSASLYEQSG